MQAVILCPTCRHLNEPGSGFCGRCWRRLADSTAISRDEAEAVVRRWLARRRLLKWARWCAVALLVAAMCAVVANYYGALDRPLPPPASNISAVAGPNDWPMFLRDPVHSAAADVPITPQGRLKWRFDTDKPLFSSPSVVDGRLYLGSGDNRIVALDADTGELIWEYAVSGPVDSSAAVAGDSVFIGLRDGRVLSLHKDSGALQWDFRTGGIFATSPVVLEGILYIGSGDGKLYTLDAQTGEVRWSYKTNGHIASDPAINDEIVAALSQDSYLHIVDKQTGRKRLDYHTKFARGSPALSGDWVYTADQIGLVTAIDWHKREYPFEKNARWVQTQLWAWGALRELPPLKGLAWAAFLPGSSFVASPIVTEDRLYVAAAEGQVYALDRETGDVEWTFEADGFFLSAMTLVGEGLFIGDRFGTMYAVSAETGEELWRFETGAPIGSTPVAANGLLYFHIGGWDAVCAGVIGAASASFLISQIFNTGVSEANLERAAAVAGFSGGVGLLFVGDGGVGGCGAAVGAVGVGRRHDDES